MKKWLKLIHFAGMTMFVGSILMYVVITTVAGKSGIPEMVFARKVISASMVCLTLSGMWLTAVSGILIAYRYYGLFSQWWVVAKLIATLIIILNAHLVLAPVASKVLAGAVYSLEHGSTTGELGTLLLRESVFGAVNIVLALFATVTGIWKFRRSAQSVKDRQSAV